MNEQGRDEETYPACGVVTKESYLGTGTGEGAWARWGDLHPAALPGGAALPARGLAAGPPLPPPCTRPRHRRRQGTTSVVHPQLWGMVDSENQLLPVPYCTGIVANLTCKQCSYPGSLNPDPIRIQIQWQRKFLDKQSSYCRGLMCRCSE